MRKTAGWLVVAGAMGLSTGCVFGTTEDDGRALGIDWDCQTGRPEEIAACKQDATKRFPGQNRFESAAAWHHIFRGGLLEASRSMAAAPESVNQVIEESDIFKVEGDTLYALNPYRGLYVIDISNPDAPRILAREAVYGSPTEMYVRDGRAYILFNDYYTWRRGQQSFQGAQVLVVAIEQNGNGARRTAETAVVGQYGLDGWLTDSRLVYEDGGQGRARLYVISSDSRYYGNWWDGSGEVVNDTHVLSLNVTDPSNIREVQRLDVPGAGHLVHANTEWIFVASQNWAARESQIKAINIQDRDGRISEAATVSVEGYVRHRFDMDFRNGALRVVSHDWNWVPGEGGRGDIHVTSFDARNMMTKTDQLDIEDIGSLQAARFADDKVYLVHVERIDPIEIVDLSNPSDLRSLGELEIPGWIAHLELRGDTVIGAGYDQGNTTVPQRRCAGYTLDGELLDEGAAFPELPGNTRKLSVSAYDVSDPATMCEASRTRFGTGQWANASFSEDKSLRLFDTDEDGIDDLFLIPWQAWEDSGSINAVQLVDVAYGPQYATALVKARGRIESEGSIDRSFPAQGRLMSLGDRELVVADIADRDNPDVTARLELSRNVQAFGVVGSHGVQLVHDWNGRTELRVVSLDDADADKGNVLSSVALDASDGRSFELYTNGNTATTVAQTWSYERIDDDGDGTIDRWIDHRAAEFTNFAVSADGQISLGGTLEIDLPSGWDGGFSQKIGNLRQIIRLSPTLFVVSAHDGLFRVVSTAGVTPVQTHGEQAPEGDYVMDDLKTFGGNTVYAIAHVPVVVPAEEPAGEVGASVTQTDEAGVAHTSIMPPWRPRAERVAYWVAKLTLDEQGRPTGAPVRVNVPGRLVDVTHVDGRETWTLLDSRWTSSGESLQQNRALFTVTLGAAGATLVDGIPVAAGVQDVTVHATQDGVARAAYMVENPQWSGPIFFEAAADGAAQEPERQTPKFVVIDLSNLEAVTLASRTELPGDRGDLRRVAQIGARRWGFLSLGWGGGLAVVDVTNARNASIDQFIRSNGSAFSIELAPSRHEAYFAAGMYGVQTVRLDANPAAAQ